MSISLSEKIVAIYPDLKGVRFNEGEFTIPGSYYEFAKRYALPSGLMFQGFIEGSADKIFESTNK